MSVPTVMTAWKSFLSAAPFNPFTAPDNSSIAIAVYKRRPPIPYETDANRGVTAVFPFITIRPGTQTKRPDSGGSIAQGGLYHLIYIDLVGATSSAATTVEDNATAFAELLGDTLASSGTNRKLNDTVQWAGEGQGVIARYDEAVYGVDELNREIYRLIIDVDVLELPEIGL